MQNEKVASVTFIILFFIPNYDKNTPTKKATFSLYCIKKAKVVLIGYECR